MVLSRPGGGVVQVETMPGVLQRIFKRNDREAEARIDAEVQNDPGVRAALAVNEFIEAQGIDPDSALALRIRERAMNNSYADLDPSYNPIEEEEDEEEDNERTDGVPERSSQNRLKPTGNARKYIQDPSQAPEGTQVQQGKRGGLYYETGVGEGVAPDSDPAAIVDAVAGALDGAGLDAANADALTEALAKNFADAPDLATDPEGQLAMLKDAMEDLGLDSGQAESIYSTLTGEEAPAMPGVAPDEMEDLDAVGGEGPDARIKPGGDPTRPSFGDPLNLSAADFEGMDEQDLVDVQSEIQSEMDLAMDEGDSALAGEYEAKANEVREHLARVRGDADGFDEPESFDDLPEEVRVEEAQRMDPMRDDPPSGEDDFYDDLDEGDGSRSDLDFSGETDEDLLIQYRDLEREIDEMYEDGSVDVPQEDVLGAMEDELTRRGVDTSAMGAYPGSEETGLGPAADEGPDEFADVDQDSLLARISRGDKEAVADWERRAKGGETMRIMGEGPDDDPFGPGTGWKRTAEQLAQDIVPFDGEIPSDEEILARWDRMMDRDPTDAEMKALKAAMVPVAEQKKRDMADELAELDATPEAPGGEGPDAGLSDEELVARVTQLEDEAPGTDEWQAALDEFEKRGGWVDTKGLLRGPGTQVGAGNEVPSSRTPGDDFDDAIELEGMTDEEIQEAYEAAEAAGDQDVMDLLGSEVDRRTGMPDGTATDTFERRQRDREASSEAPGGEGPDAFDKTQDSPTPEAAAAAYIEQGLSETEVADIARSNWGAEAVPEVTAAYRTALDASTRSTDELKTELGSIKDSLFKARGLEHSPFLAEQEMRSAVIRAELEKRGQARDESSIVEDPPLHGYGAVGGEGPEGTNASVFTDHFEGGNFVQSWEDEYEGRSGYVGPAMVIDKHDLDDVEAASPIELHVDGMGRDQYIVYPRDPKATASPVKPAASFEDLTDLKAEYDDARAAYDRDRRNNTRDDRDPALRRRVDQLEHELSRRIHDKWRGMDIKGMEDQALIDAAHKFGKDYLDDSDVSGAYDIQDRFIDELDRRGLADHVFEEDGGYLRAAGKVDSGRIQPGKQDSLGEGGAVSAMDPSLVVPSIWDRTRSEGGYVSPEEEAFLEAAGVPPGAIRDDGFLDTTGLIASGEGPDDSPGPATSVPPALNPGEMAALIRKDWKNVAPEAKPYLDAISNMNNWTDQYYADSPRSVAAYALGNLTKWKGETAREVKKQLKAIANGKPPTR